MKSTMHYQNSNSQAWWKHPNLIRTLIDRYGEETAKAYLREKFKHEENILPFAFICFPHYFQLKSPPFHSIVLSLFRSPDNTGICAPRGFAKSTMMLIDDTFDIVNAYKNYIVKISDSYTQALEQTMNLQTELENNEIIRWIYGSLVTESWSQGDFITAFGTKVVAKGAGMKIRGLRYGPHRPDKINIDDLENDEAVANAERRKKLLRWLKTNVMPSIAKGGKGKINIIGTILHGDSLLSKIVNKQQEFAGWTTAKFQALNEKKDTKEKVSLWAEMLSVEKLIAMRDDPQDPDYQGWIVFNQEYQNQPISDEEAIIKRSWIMYYDTLPVDIVYKIVVVDPAISKKDTADFTAIQCWGLGSDGHLYLIEKLKKRMGFTETGTEIRAMCHRHNTKDVLIEEVSYQKALQEHQKLAPLAIHKITPDADKRRRLIVTSKWFEALYVHFKEQHDSVVEEIVSFGETPHDDECDCAVYAISFLKEERGKIRAKDIGFA